jgi:hypothetical protein
VDKKHSLTVFTQPLPQAHFCGLNLWHAHAHAALLRANAKSCTTENTMGPGDEAATYLKILVVHGMLGSSRIGIYEMGICF